MPTTYSPATTRFLTWVMLAISLGCLFYVPINYHAGHQLESAPLCSVSDTYDCVREVKVTVVATYHAKSGSHVRVVTPNGGDADLKIMQLRSGFYVSADSSLLYEFAQGSEVDAYQWRGKIVALLSPIGKLPTSNDPRTNQLVYVLVGVIGTAFAGFRLWPEISRIVI